MKDELIVALRGLQRPTPAKCFALLWSYFDVVGFGVAGNELRGRGVLPVQLEWTHRDLESRGAGLQRRIEELAAKLSAPGFDADAARWLKGLSRVLDDFGAGEGIADQATFTGLRGTTWAIRRLSSFVSLSSEELPPDARQGLSAQTFARSHRGVPLEPIKGFTIAFRGARTWLGASLELRLRAAGSRIRVMLWPLARDRGFLAEAEVAMGGTEPFASIDRMGDEDAVAREIVDAVAAARAEQATLLVLSELSVSMTGEEALRVQLGTGTRDGHPILTAFGRCHVRQPSGLDWNEAVLLGPGGEVLHVHRKLTSYVERAGDGYLSERLEAGDTLTVLESPLGNVALLICRDLIEPAIRQRIEGSHANVFVVPSLSATTERHQDVAAELHGSRLAATFVANTWPQGWHARHAGQSAASFFRVPRSSGESQVLHDVGATATARYLLFDAGA